MLEKINLVKRVVNEFNYSEDLKLKKEMVGKSGFIQIGLKKPDKINFSEDNIINIKFDVSLKALLNETELDSIDDDNELPVLFEIAAKFSLIYNGLEGEDDVNSLADENYWFIEKDANIFLRDFVTNFLANTTFGSISLPLHPQS